MRPRIDTLAWGFVFLFAAAGRALAQGYEDFADMMREELNMKTAIESKKVQTISESPGIISVLTEEDLRNMAFENLNDVLQTIPGVTGTESFFGYFSLSFRGIKETHYNNRTLLLLNGHPIRDVTVGTHWPEAIPINAIERVEIIRGPGSVVYGDGAFAGVINVITKTKVDSTDLSIRYGSKQSVFGAVGHGKTFENLEYYAAGTYNHGRGYEANVRDEAGNLGQLGYYPGEPDGYENNHRNFFTHASVGDAQADTYYFRQQKDKFGIIPDLRTTGEAKSGIVGGALRYGKDIHDIALNSLVYYSRSWNKNYLDHFPPTSPTPLNMNYSGDKWGLNLDGRKSVTDTLSVLSGATFEWQKTYSYPFPDPVSGQPSAFSAFLRNYDTHDASLYGQLELTPIDRLTLVAGARYNHNKDYGGAIVPRAGAVFGASDNLYFKALYGSAYRSPTFFEKYVNTRNVLYGDPDLKPEKINTLELAADWLTGQNVFRLTLFTLRTEDMIGRVRTYNSGDLPPVQSFEQRTPSTIPSVATPGYANASGQQIEGIEFEIKGAAPAKALSYTANISYKDGRERTPYIVTGTQESRKIQYLDKLVGNLTLTHRWKRLANTATLRYVGARKGNIMAPAAPGFTAGQEVRVAPYHIVNVKSGYRPAENVEVALMIVNLFGQAYGYPEYIRRRIDVIPADPDRSFFGQVSYKF